MNFWEKVDQERELKNLTRKELAHIAKFSLNSISTGIARNSIPAADVAVRIANALGTTVECLMGQKSSHPGGLGRDGVDHICAPVMRHQGLGGRTGAVCGSAVHDGPF